MGWARDIRAWVKGANGDAASGKLFCGYRGYAEYAAQKMAQIHNERHGLLVSQSVPVFVEMSTGKFERTVEVMVSTFVAYKITDYGEWKERLL